MKWLKSIKDGPGIVLIDKRQKRMMWSPYRKYKIKIDKKYENGLYKTDQEYGKALQWLFEDKPIIPNWLLEEINGYEEKLVISKNK